MLVKAKEAEVNSAERIIRPQCGSNNAEVDGEGRIIGLKPLGHSTDLCKFWLDQSRVWIKVASG